MLGYIVKVFFTLSLVVVVFVCACSTGYGLFQTINEMDDWLAYTRHRYRRAEAQRNRITLSTQADRNGDVTTSLAKAFVDASDPG